MTSAADNDYRVTINLSNASGIALEVDAIQYVNGDDVDGTNATASGVSVGSSQTTLVTLLEEIGIVYESNGTWCWNTNSFTSDGTEDAVETVADVTKITFEVTSGTTKIASGTLFDDSAQEYDLSVTDGNGNDTYANALLVDHGTYSITLTFEVDNVTAGVQNGGTQGDTVDDRDQIAYTVRLETGVDTDLFQSTTYTYWYDASDDIASKLNNDEYDEQLPSWNVSVLQRNNDGDYDEYYLVYTIYDEYEGVENVIVATYELVSESYAVYASGTSTDGLSNVPKI